MRFVSIVLGFAGLFVILGIDQGPPLPRNLGDWLALGAGVGWAITAVRPRAGKVNEAEEITFLYFVPGSVAALATCALPDGRTGPVPDLETIVGVLPWLAPAPIALISAAGLLDALWHARDEPAPRD